ncbi:efflux RND transporter periplasmic adaptor subunit [Limobrevibacterium gyesilva]|uniref:Efflux RND transporter periplasmic adaptor subunit n=1 Tax=Limobrevibacterium gyesilva TaxID=2991712 RepID=A0AA42CHK1_9PROT|nr:efflux RND transporter periplasmic adaptor subunit [Limobrevibacterium gyesilva]MCW3474950.1 efflux RND transporter periplasmic adaptor subunit [Limobrevibacterium gyesilva]
MKTQRRWRFLDIFLGCLAATTVARAAAAQDGPPAPQVAFAVPLARRVAQWDEYTGRFEAVQRVEVRPRVSGYIAAIHFTDGAIVAKGDVLFTIDPRPYEIAVEQARADVLRNQAQVQQAAVDFSRAQDLVRTAAVTVRELDQRRATLDVDRAQLMSAEASRRNAELNLEWTRVTAPFAGRISDRKVDAGNLVTGTGDPTLLTTIVTLDPIHFVFEASETDYIRYARLNASGQRPSSRDVPNPVQVRLSDETEWTHMGRMNFVDNEVNAHSGTIRGRAVFDNKDYFFAPGTFGRLRVFGGFMDVLLVPDGSVVSDQARKILFTVGADNKVVAKPVTQGPIALGLRVVVAGLAPDDKVIIGGLANPFVRPGAVVKPTPGEIMPVEAKPDAGAVPARPLEVKAGEVKAGSDAKPAERPATN